MHDNTLISIYGHMSDSRHCSSEDMLEAPELRTEFLARCRQELGNLPERYLLHRLGYLRKKRRLPSRRKAPARTN
jgi:hypothetical protein